MSSSVSVKDFKKEAEGRLSRMVVGYFNSGATAETTLRNNEKAIQRWYIRPRVLVDVTSRDLSTNVLGYQVDAPFGVAPTAMQKLAHPAGESAIARAAARAGIVFTLSTFSTTSIEEVAVQGGNGLKFFQLFIFKDRDLTADLVRCAEKLGYKALVLTLDCPYPGVRYEDLRNKFSLPPHVKLPTLDPRSKEEASHYQGEGGLNEYLATLCDLAVVWKDVAWLKKITSLPIVLKGIVTAEDALLALEAGAAAIWVSNHGGRQIDGVLPTIDALPEVVGIVKGRCEVYVDGGFRSGTDVFKALALGARMVFLGRPLLWGLACDGEEGAFKVLKIIRNELDNTMTLSGCTSLSQITSRMVARNPLSSL